MTQKPQSSVSSSSKFGTPLPAASLVEDEDGGEDVPYAVAHEVTHEGGAGIPDPQRIAQVHQVNIVVDQAPSRSGRIRLFVIGLGWLLTALAQFIVAMVVKNQGIEVIDYFIGETFYPRAGNPWIGLFHFIMAAIFLVAIVGCQHNDGCCVCIGCFYTWAIITDVISFLWSFWEQAVYSALKDFDECVDSSVDDNYTLDWGGDCYCWDYEGGTPPVNVDASTSCENIPDYVDSIFASCILMVTLVALSVAAFVVPCCTAPYVRCC